jgi:hypothetical protein
MGSTHGPRCRLGAAVRFFSFFLLLLLFGTTAVSQQLFTTQKDEQHSRSNRFLGRWNVAVLSVSAAAITADAISTQKYLGLGGFEKNPIARPLVKTRIGGGFAAAGGFAAEYFSMYYAHRHAVENHSKFFRFAERAIPVATIAVEGALAGHNYYNANNSIGECEVHHGRVNFCFIGHPNGGF